MEFQIYDTNGGIRNAYSDVSPDRLRSLLSVFKTHCVVNGKQYEYNHFVNWLNKYYDIALTYVSDDVVRIDM